MLLTPALLIFGSNYALMKIWILLISIGAFYLFYRLLKSCINDSSWIFPLGLFAFSPLIINYSHDFYSEIPYLFFSLLALYLFERFKILKRETIVGFIVMIFIFVSSYYIRTVGLSLILAAGFLLFYKKHYKELIVFIIIASIFIFLWQSRSARLGAGGYLQQFFTRNPYDMESIKISFGEYLNRFFGNLKIYTLFVFPQILFPSLQSSGLLNSLGFIFSILVLLGLISRIKHVSVWEIYTILFLGIAFSWPEVWTGDRFLLPILPLLFYYLFKGIKVLIKKSQAVSGLVTGFCVLFAIINFIQTTPANLANFNAFIRGDKMAGYPSDWQHYFQALEWIKNNIPENAVVISRKPQFTYLFSHHKSAGYPFTSDENKIFEAFQKNHAQYILFDRFNWTGTTVKYLGPIVQKYPDKFHVIYKTSAPEMYVLKIL
jgi:hypothetical protein